MKPVVLALLGTVAGAAAAAAVIRPWESRDGSAPKAATADSVAHSSLPACPVASVETLRKEEIQCTKTDDAKEGSSAPLLAFAKVSEHLYRSAQPDGEAAFRQAAEAGIRVIVSVDGARPDVEGAQRFGLRYVHVPIGYDGITSEQAATITKVVTTLEGPFLFHCHHGKHRGPAACALALRALEGADAESAVAVMKSAGTAEMYSGLWRDVRGFVMPDAKVLASLPSEFPAAVAPAGLRKAMVDLDHGWDSMKAIRDAGWKALADHPDLAPSHQAVIIAEAFREMARLEEIAHRPGDFRRRLEESEKAAWDLAGILDEPTPDAARAKELFTVVDKSCTSCHSAYRNTK